MNSVLWNIAVSPDTDQSVRMILAAQDGGRKGDFSRFIEEAVRANRFEQAVAQAKTAATKMNETELADLIDEECSGRVSTDQKCASSWIPTCCSPR